MFVDLWTKWHIYETFYKDMNCQIHCMCDAHKILSPQTRNIFIIQEQWLPQLKWLLGTTPVWKIKNSIWFRLESVITDGGFYDFAMPLLVCICRVDLMLSFQYFVNPSLVGHTKPLTLLNWESFMIMIYIWNTYTSFTCRVKREENDLTQIPVQQAPQV